MMLKYLFLLTFLVYISDHLKIYNLKARIRQTIKFNLYFLAVLRMKTHNLKVRIRQTIKYRLKMMLKYLFLLTFLVYISDHLKVYNPMVRIRQKIK
jgi:hypothetical protein